MVATINWSGYFIGFDEVGTLLGSFISNLLIAILPAVLVIGIIMGFVTLFIALAKGVGGMLKFHRYK